MRRSASLRQDVDMMKRKACQDASARRGPLTASTPPFFLRLRPLRRFGRKRPAATALSFGHVCHLLFFRVHPPLEGPPGIAVGGGAHLPERSAPHKNHIRFWALAVPESFWSDARAASFEGDPEPHPVFFFFVPQAADRKFQHLLSSWPRSLRSSLMVPPNREAPPPLL